jgi:hypothetical protein
MTGQLQVSCAYSYNLEVHPHIKKSLHQGLTKNESNPINILTTCSVNLTVITLLGQGKRVEGYNDQPTDPSGHTLLGLSETLKNCSADQENKGQLQTC